MVSAIGAFTTMFATARAIDAGNRVFANNDRMMQNTANASKMGVPFGANYQPIHEAEKSLVASNLQNALMYKIAMQQLKNQDNKENKKLNYLA